MTRILVVGGTGLLGQYLREEALSRRHEILWTQRSESSPTQGRSIELDLTNLDTFAQVVREAAPDVVLNAAAMTDVDGCEREPDLAKTVNAAAPARLAEAAREEHATFVHFSTDYVFDGTGPATESTEPNPLGLYGRTKLEGERRVLAVNPKALVLRLSAVFGWNRMSAKTNAVTWILAKLEPGHEVSLFQDQTLTPTYAKTAAEAAFDLWSQQAFGIFHVACRDRLSRVEMGRAVADVFQFRNARLKPISMSSVPLLAKRPFAPCLVVDKVEETLKRDMPRFRDCLEHMKATR